MGSDNSKCIDVNKILSAGKAVINDYFSQSMFGQMTDAMSAHSECASDDTQTDLKRQMKCQLLEGQKETWEGLLCITDRDHSSGSSNGLDIQTDSKAHLST